MSIHNEMTIAVREHLWDPYLRDQLYNQSPTCQILDSMARMVKGPAGDGIGIVSGTKTTTGRHYKGFDQVRFVGVERGAVKNYTDWAFFQADVGLAETELVQNLGLTIAEVTQESFSLGSVAPTARESLFSIAGERYSDAGDLIGLVKSADLWGRDLPERKGGPDQRRPESLKQLYDYESSWNGLAPDELGTWEEGIHPWYHNPPNELPDTHKRLVNVPQVWGLNATPRQLSKSVVSIPLQHMQNVGGVWLGPVHPSLWDPFASEFDGNDQGPLLIGWDMWRLGITCIQYYNCFFYIDDHAPADEVDMIHVGRPEMSDNQRRGAGFQMAYWVPNNIMEHMQMIMNNNTLSEEVIPMAVRMGRNDRMPLYPRGWLILESQASAIADRAQVTYAQVGAYRWKNIRLMNLAA